MDNSYQSFMKTITPGMQTAGSAVMNGLTNNPVSKFLFGDAINTAKDIGAGMGYNSVPGLQQSQNDAYDQARKSFALSLQTKDPKQRAALQKVAQETLDTINQGAQQQQNSFSPDINQSYVGRGLKSGLEVGSGADLISHPIAAVKGVVDTARGGLKAAMHPINTLDAISNGLEHLPETIAGIPDAVSAEIHNPDNFRRVADPNNPLTKLGNRFLAGQYKDIGKFTDDPAELMGKLADYGIDSPDKTAKVASLITGKNGHANKMVMQSLQDAGPIDTSGMIDNAKEVLNNTMGISERDSKIAMGEVSKAVDKATTEASGISGGDPEKMVDTLRQWEHKLYTAKPDTPEQRIYSSLVGDLKQRLFFRDGVPIPMTADLDPAAYKQIAGYSKQLADDLNAAPTAMDARHLQSMFVQGDQAAQATTKAASGSLNAKQALLTGAAALNPTNPISAGVALSQTGGGQRVLGNTLRGIGSLNAGGAQTGLDLASQYLTHDSSATPSSVGVTDNNNQQNNANNSPHAPIVSQTVPQSNGPLTIPQSMNEIQPNPQTGRYSDTVVSPFTATDSTGSPIALSSVDYNQQKVQLTQQLAQAQTTAKYNGSPQAQQAVNAISGQLSSLESKNSVSQQLTKSYTDAKNLSFIADNAKALLKDSDPDLLSLYPTYDKLRQASDGKYAKLADALKILEDRIPGMGPGTLFRPQTSQVASAVLDQAGKVILNDYYSSLAPYVGGQQVTQHPAQGLPPTIQPLAQQAAPPSSQGGGWVQAMPPNPMMQLGSPGQ